MKTALSLHFFLDHLTHRFSQIAATGSQKIEISFGTASCLLVRSTVMFAKRHFFEWVALLLDIREVLGSYLCTQKAFLGGSCDYFEFSRILELYRSSPYFLACILRSSVHLIVLPLDNVMVSDLFIETLSNLRVTHRMLLLCVFFALFWKRIK